MLKRLFIVTLLVFSGFRTGAGALRAQEPVGVALEVTPSVGMAAITRNGNLESGGMSALMEIDLRSASLSWSAYASTRGIGAGCSNGCDLGGKAFGVGTSYLFGSIGVGGGVGLLRRSAEWHVQPHGRLSVVRGALRFQVRLEAPEGVGGVHVPVLFGWRIPIG